MTAVLEEYFLRYKVLLKGIGVLEEYFLRYEVLLKGNWGVGTKGADGCAE